MCRIKADPTDPLLKLFHDSYGLNLLAVPTEDAEPGQLVIAVPGAVGRRVESDALLDGPLEPLAVERGVVMADIGGLASQAVTTEIGASVSEVFIRALGAVGLAAEMSGTLRANAAGRVRFAFAEPMLDRLNLAVLRGRIVQRHVSKESPFHDPAAAYYVVSAVARSRSIDVILDADRQNDGRMTVELASLAEAEAAVTAQKVDARTIRVSGARALAFGVELLRLTLSETGRLRLGVPTNPLRMRGPTTTPARPERVFPGDGYMFLDLPAG